MKITIKKEIKTPVEEIIEIDLPAYYEYGSEVRIAEDKIISVFNNELRFYPPEMASHFVEKGIKTTEAAFNNAFQKALSKWNQIATEIQPKREKFIPDHDFNIGISREIE